MTVQGRLWRHLMLRALHAAVRRMAQGPRSLPSRHACVRMPEGLHYVGQPWEVERRLRQATLADIAPPESYRPAVRSAATPDSTGPELQAPAAGSTCRDWTLVERPGYQIVLPGPIPRTHRLKTGMNALRGTQVGGVGDLCPARCLPAAPAANRSAVSPERRNVTLASTSYARARPQCADRVSWPRRPAVGFADLRAPPPSLAFGLPRSGWYRSP